VKEEKKNIAKLQKENKHYGFQGHCRHGAEKRKERRNSWESNADHPRCRRIHYQLSCLREHDEAFFNEAYQLIVKK
jgi:hypothetical protein